MGTHPIFESDFDCLTVNLKMRVLKEIEETIPFPTENDALQAMKDEGAFDELRRTLLECLDKTSSYTSLKNDLGNNIDHFLSNQKWKNSTEHQVQLRKNLRIHIKKSQIMRFQMPNLIREVLRKYSKEIIAPRVEKKVTTLVEKHDQDIEELRKKHNEAAKAKKSELPPKRIQNHDQQASKDVAVNINDEHITPKES